MSGAESILEAVISIVIIAIFLTIVFPALSKATGTDMTIFSIALILMIIAVVAGVFRGRQ